MTLVAGVDGCPAGWFVVRQGPDPEHVSTFIAASFDELLAELADASVIAVDIPIGLPATACKGGRAVDLAARKLLGKGRTSSVFSCPARAAVYAADYKEALRLSRESTPEAVGLSKQAFMLAPKIREVDAAVRERGQELIREVHPELCFGEMNRTGGIPEGKKSEEGLAIRKRLLINEGYSAIPDMLRFYKRKDAALDDILDAFAACWTARRIAAGTARRIPEGEPPVDSCGLRMEMWI